MMMTTMMMAVDFSDDKFKFRFEQFRTAQATTVPIPEALTRGTLFNDEDDDAMMINDVDIDDVDNWLIDGTTTSQWRPMLKHQDDTS